MELTLQTNKSALFIKNYEDSCLYIADKVYDHNIVIIENIKAYRALLKFSFIVFIILLYLYC